MTSFSKISFSSVSFDVGQEQAGTAGGSASGNKQTRNKWRAWVASLARGFRDFFKIKQRPPESEPVPIPTPQYAMGRKVTILSSPPTKENPISVTASIPPALCVSQQQVEEHQEHAPLPVYPYILNPLTAPLIQTKVTLPRATRSQEIPKPIRAEGSHIESFLINQKKPKQNKSKAAAINTLMLMLEIERQV